MGTINHQSINKKPIEVKNKINSQLKRYFSIIKWVLRNYIKTKREFGTFYGKGKKVLLKIILGNIKKKKLNLKESAKGD